MRQSRIFLVCLLFPVTAFSQGPRQIVNENYFQPLKEVEDVTLEASPYFFQSDIASDGYGHHYVTVDVDGGTKRVVHHLIDNDGVVLDSHQFPANTSNPSVTAYEGWVHVILREVVDEIAVLKLYRSTNGGVTWTNPGNPTRSISGTFTSLDSYEDANGIHLTYGSSGASGGTRYFLRDRTSDIWLTLPQSVEGQTGGLNAPSIVTDDNLVLIYLGEEGQNHKGVYSLDLEAQDPEWSDGGEYLCGGGYNCSKTRR